MAIENPQDYMQFVADQIVAELEPVLRMKQVTNNSALLGNYAEAVIRRLIKRIVKPMNVSTGAVVHYPLPEKLRQIDLLIWSPYPAPGLFEIDDFSLVPLSNVFGVIEIKKSNYTDTDNKLIDFLESEDLLTFDEYAQSLAGNMSERNYRLGIICEANSNLSCKLQELVKTLKVVILFERKSVNEIQVRKKDVLHLINFLSDVTCKFRQTSLQKPSLNIN